MNNAPMKFLLRNFETRKMPTSGCRAIQEVLRDIIQFLTHWELGLPPPRHIISGLVTAQPEGKPDVATKFS